MAVQIGPKIGIDGEKEYREQIKAITDQTKSLAAAMDKTASTFSKNTSQMTKNKAIAQNLAENINLQSDKLSIFNKMLDEATAKFGANSSAAQAWQRAVDSATASLNRMKSELQEFNGAENFSDLSTKLADVGQSLTNIGSKMATIGGVMTAAITVPLAAIGKSAVDMASDMEEASSKVDVIFGSMSESVKSFADTSLESYGVSNVKAMEMMGTFGAMATEMGLSDKAAAQMATTLTGLAGDLAAFHNAEIDVTQTALEGIFTGQTRALTQFAGAINQANLEEFAARQGKVYDKMSEGEKVLTRYQLVLERTRDAQGNFAATGEGFAGSMQKFQGAVEELKVAIGEQLLPIITPIVQHFTKLIQIFASLPEPVQKVIVVFAAIVAAVGPLLVIVGTLMMSLGSIITQAPIIAGALASIIPAVQGLAASFAELTAAAAPWLLLAAAIAAAGYLIYANWDDISAAAQNMAQNVKNAFNKLMNINNQIKTKMHGIVETIVDAFLSLPGKIAEALQTAIQKIQDTFNQMVQTAKESGQHMIEGFVEGIKEKVSKVVEAVKNVANTVKDFLGFSRPDKGPLHEYEEWMPHFMQGLAKGINANKSLVTRAIDSLANDMALPLDANASMNMALAGADGSTAGVFGGFTMNVSVDHINDLNDLLRIQQQAQQRIRMGAR